MQLKLFIGSTFLFMVSMVLAHVYLSAKNSASAKASVRMTVIRPSIVKTAQNLVIPTKQSLEGGYVSVHSDTAAQIQVSGEPNQSLNIVVPNIANGKKIKVGSSHIKLSNIETSPQYMASLNAQGQLNLKLGAHWQGVAPSEVSAAEEDDSSLNVTLTY